MSRVTTVAIIVIVIVIIAVGGYAAVILTNTSTKTTSSTTSTSGVTTTTSSASSTKSAPSSILIGTTYASTGPYASLSVPVHEGLQLWVDSINSQGGIFVSAYNEKLPVQLISYDDQSSPSTAGTFYNQLVTVNHVNILVADASSTMTAPAVPITEANHVLQISPFAFASSLFNASNPYNVGMYPAIVPTDGYIVPELLNMNVSASNFRFAIVYAQTVSNTPQAQDIVSRLAAVGITPVANIGFPSSQSDFTSIVAQLQTLNLTGVMISAGDSQESAFLNALGAANLHIPYVFSTYAGVEISTFESQVGSNLKNVFSWGYPPLVNYPVNLGPNFTEFAKIWASSFTPSSVLYGAIGYSTGVVIQDAIQTAGSLNSLSVRNAMNEISSKLVTMWGPFTIDPHSGAQLFPVPVIQFQANSTGAIAPQVVYPQNVSTAKAVYSP